MSLRGLVKTSDIPVSKVTHFLYTKVSYLKFFGHKWTQEKEGFVWIKAEVWCMYLAHVGKLAKDKNGVK